MQDIGQSLGNLVSSFSGVKEAVVHAFGARGSEILNNGVQFVDAFLHAAGVK